MATITRPTDTAVGDRRTNRPDFLLILTIVALSGFGLVMVYSATRFALERSDSLGSFSVERQAIFVTAGLIAFYVISAIDYREFRNVLPIIYAVTILLLALVFLFPEINGARRWIPLGVTQLQPAEFAKVAVIICVGALLAARTKEDEPLRWAHIFQSGLLMAVPTGLIVLQPDLGTAMVMPFIWLVMLFVAGMTWRQAATIGVVGVSVVALAWRLQLFAEHQLDRITVFFDETVDPQGIGYQLRQSKLAIGSGQLTGRGLFEGSQTNFSYVPDQETDFIFTAVGEQLGFIGGVLVIGLFTIVIWRLVMIALNARDRFGMLITMGVAAMIAFHVFVNIGMTIGIAPVTGLPLPFFSMGGSFYLAMAMAVGICNSIWLRRTPVPGERYRL